MNFTEPQIHAHAIFATTSGMNVVANGILASKLINTGLFDFGDSRSEAMKLLAGKEISAALFRRRITTDGGRSYELLGVFSPCVDQSGRPGMFGSCVAIDPDTSHNNPVFHDWVYAFEEAIHLFKQIAESKDQNGAFVLPKQPIIPQNPAPQNITLLKHDRNELILYNDREENDHTKESTRQLQAVSFYNGDAHRVILVYPSYIQAALPLFAGNNTGYLEEFQRDAQAALNRPKRADPVTQSIQRAMASEVHRQRPATSPDSLSISEGLAVIDQQLIHVIEQLKVDLNLAHDRIDRLQEQLETINQPQTYSAPSQRTTQTLPISQASANGISKWKRIAAIGGGATGLILVAILVYINPFKGSEDKSPVTEQTFEEPAKPELSESPP